MKIRIRHAESAPVRPPAFTFRKRRQPKLDPALYMRPIRASRIGHVNTDWATDGWHRQGVPVGKSLILVLKCGHIVIVPQRPTKIRKLVHCDMCVRLWTERTLEEEESKRRRKKAEKAKRKHQLTQEIDMSKKAATKKVAKKAVAKKSAPASDRRGRIAFEFAKVAKEMADNTIEGIVYAAIKKIKSGTTAEVCEAAIKGGLKEVTGQDPLAQTGVWLNRLKQKGYVRKAEVKKERRGAEGDRRAPAKVFNFKKKKGSKAA